MRKNISLKTLIERMGALAFGIALIVVLSVTVKAETAGTVTDSNVNIRQSATTESASLGKVNKDDKVTILEEQKNNAGDTWYKVQTANGTVGYIKSDFVKKDGANNTTTPATTTNVTPTESKTAYVVKDGANIRTGASTTAAAITQAPLNLEVTVTGEAQAEDGYKWYQISFKATDGSTKTGFIRSDMITYTKPTADPQETSISTPEPEPEPEPEPDPEPVNNQLPSAQIETNTNAGDSSMKNALNKIAPTGEPEVIPAGFTETTMLEEGEDPETDGVKAWTKGDYVLLYGVDSNQHTGWYLLDSATNRFISADNLFEESKQTGSGKLFGFISLKFVLVIVIVLLLLSLTGNFILALKLTRGVENDDDYEYDYDDDDEEEDEIPVSSIEDEQRGRGSREREPKAEKRSGRNAKDKFLDYFTKEVDEDDEEEYYEDDDDDIDMIDI